MKKETKVNCEVDSCKHNEEKCCCLEELDISCACDSENCSEKEETICNNFEKHEEDYDCEEYDESYYSDDLDEKLEIDEESEEESKEKEEYIDIEETL